MSPGSPDDLHRRSLAGRRVLVLGLGRFGGGVETTRFLVSEGARVTVSDAGSREALAEPAAEAEALGATLVFGPQTPELLAGHDLVIASPAIPFEHPVLAAAAHAGIPCTTEIDFVLARAPCPVFGITGTKGKSTTTSLLTALLDEPGRTVHRGGNIGQPLIARLREMSAEDRIVLELSSFQLWWAGRHGLAPQVALITNLFPDHLDRHGTFAAYAEAKRAMFDGQDPSAVAVLPDDDPTIRSHGFFEAGAGQRIAYGTPKSAIWAEDAGRSVHFADGRRLDLGALALAGAHNRRNLLAALAATEALPRIRAPALDLDTALARARSVAPLPHRLDPVAEVGGVQFIDDSNATNPASTIVALEAMERPTVLLLGGKDKGAPREALLAAVRARAKAVVTMGSTGPSLAEALGDALPVASGGASMAEAVSAAMALTAPGDCVLLSPAFSSLDQYPSFVLRARAFREAITGLAT